MAIKSLKIGELEYKISYEIVENFNKNSENLAEISSENFKNSSENFTQNLAEISSENFKNSSENFTQNLAENSSQKIPQILILHGWGANKELMISAFAKHFSHFRLIFIDLPGFGKSAEKIPLNTEKYAQIVAEFMKIFGKFHAVLGHSFGGKVASLIVKMGLCENLVLLSTAGIIEPKPLKIRAKIAFFKLLKSVGLGRFYKIFASKDANNLSPVMYQTFKNVVNEDFEAIFASLKAKKVLIFWGESDKAVSLKSGEKIAEITTNSKFYPLSGDHFFFLNHAKFIAYTIETELKC